ncbi:hypothetical protein [Pontibacter qinzhouensis]|nr:hypothetical protein [Pontibacter qinzhouensis]
MYRNNLLHADVSMDVPYKATLKEKSPFEGGKGDVAKAAEKPG